MFIVNVAYEDKDLPFLGVLLDDLVDENVVDRALLK